MREQILRRAAELVPVLKQRAALTEQMRRVPDETVDDFIAAQLMRVAVPRRYGGLDVGHEVMFEIAFELGRACGASAWCYSLWAVHSWLMGFWPQEAQEEFYAGGPDTLASSAFAPDGKTLTPCDGGYRVSGQWQFSSGCDASAWVVLGARGPSGLAWILVPRADYEIVDTWFVSGLSGSGSKDIRIDDKFVPTHRVLLDPFNAGDKDETAWDLHSEARYRVPLRMLLGWDLVSPLVGIAHGCIDEFVARIKAQSSGARTSDSVAMQLRLAQASAEVDAAKAVFMADIRKTLEAGASGARISELDRARDARDRAFVSNLCLQAINRLFEASGAHALFQTEPIQRFHRDAHALSHRDLMMMDIAGQAYGKLALSADGGSGVK
jgi:3-hydroxy-9,10-secoandrosta-1,3,5(10)-triene-9,17-dione monooxygenase